MIYLGYYTDPSNTPRGKKSSGWLLPIIIGLVVGILLMIVVYPNFIGKRSVMNEGNNDQIDTSQPNNDQTGPKEHITVDVTTQITDIVDKVSPAVVGVTNIQLQSDFWRNQGKESEAGTGSGVIYKIENDYAYIVTNHHVVDQADLLEVVLSDDTNLEAELLGSDLFTEDRK